MHRQHHQVLLLMHNPLHQQLQQQQEQLRSQHVPATGSFQITGCVIQYVYFTPKEVYRVQD
jgi:hypothetical protein